MLQGLLPPAVYQVLLILHVLAAMVWLSATASVPRRLREALHGDARPAIALLRSIASQRRQAPISSLTVFVTGVLLALHLGFPKIDVRYHIALTTTLILFLIDVGPARAGLHALVDAAQSSIGPHADRLRKRVGMMTGIQHALFLATLVLMLWRL